MKIKRIVVLLMLLGLLGFTSMHSANADAGGACLGQWSECHEGCSNLSNQLWVQQCQANCAYQRDRCLGLIY